MAKAVRAARTKRKGALSQLTRKHRITPEKIIQTALFVIITKLGTVKFARRDKIKRSATLGCIAYWARLLAEIAEAWAIDG